MVSLTVDGLIYASWMVMLDAARRKTPVPALARWLLGLGIAATLAANVAHGLGHGLTGAAVAAWPAVALVGSYELLMVVVRSAQAQAEGCRVGEHEADPLQQRAAEIFAEQLAGIEFLLSERFARNSVLASHVHNDCRSTWPQRPEGMAKTCGIADPAHQLPRDRRVGVICPSAATSAWVPDLTAG
jgi:hypothetical protein